MENNLKALFMIVNAGFAEETIEIAREEGIVGATILNARGEGALHETVLGITIDSEKEIIFCIADKATADKAMAALRAKAGIKSPAHCVCFMLPVDKAMGLNLPEAQV